MRLLLITALACAAFPTLARSEEPRMVMVLSGACETFGIGGNDLSKNCLGKLAYHSKGNADLAFHFSFPEGVRISLNGRQEENPTSAKGEMVLKAFSIRSGGVSEPQRFPLEGTCTYGNPFGGKARIECKGKAADGSEAQAVFVTDGTSPLMLPPG